MVNGQGVNSKRCEIHLVRSWGVHSADCKVSKGLSEDIFSALLDWTSRAWDIEGRDACCGIPR